MTKKYTLQNVGKPMTAVPADAWKNLSQHTSAEAALKAIDRHTAHLDYGQWDDHYRIISPDGSVVNTDEARWEMQRKENERESRKYYR